MFARNPRPQTPAKVGKYTIEQTIGQGGFGQVYRAFDASVGRSVAIKVLKAGADPTDLTRFRNEASAAGNLHHKNIVTVHEFGEQDGFAYLVMEFVEGEDLLHAMQSGRLDTVLQKMQIMSQVAEGLYCAHQHGVVHRDVKPANIMILPDEKVKIMDFGIARLLHVNHATLTQAGFLVGSVPYMSPEQFRDETIDALCDIWAYGVIYYELLTGTHPFAGTDATTIMYKITATEPAHVRELAPDCPRELADVIMRAMAKDRDLRYQSLEDLRLDTEPVILALQKERAVELAREARAHADENAWELVQTKVRQVLELDSTNTVARQLRDVLRQRSHREVVRPKVDALVKQGEEHLSQRRFHEAIESFESALRLDTADSGVRSRLLAAHSQYEQSKKATDLVKDAWRELKTRNLTAAFERLTEALQLDPGHAEGQRAMAAVEEENRRRQVEREIAQQIDKAAGLARLQQFDDAFSILSSLRSTHGAVQAIEEAWRAVEENKARQEKARQLAAFVDTAKDQLKQGQFEAAVMRLRTALIDFPRDDELGRLLAYAEQQLENQRRMEALENVRAESRRLIDSGHYDAALTTIEIALKAHPGDAPLVELMQDAVKGKASQRREAAISAALRRSDELAANSSFKEALDLIRETQDEHGDDPRLEDLSDRLRAEIDRAGRAEAVRNILAQASQLSRKGDMDSAIAVLQAAESQYPDSNELHEALSIARRTQAAQDEKRAVAATLANADAREKDQQWAAALNIIETGLLAYPGSEELNQRATSLRDRIADEELKRVVARECREIEGLIALRRFEEAAQRLKSVRAAYPAEPGFEDLLARFRTETRAFREQTVERVRGFLRQGDPGRAQYALRQSLECLPADPTLTALEREIDNERRCRACVDSAAAQMKSGEFVQAQKLLEDALRIVPGHPAATDLLRELALRRNQLERDRRIEEGRRRAKEFIRENKFDDARRELADLLKMFPDATELWSDVAEIETLKQRQTEEDRGEPEFTALFQLGDSGTDGGTQLFESPDDTRGKELAAWANYELERDLAGRGKTDRETGKPSSQQSGRRTDQERSARRARARADLERAEQLAREKAVRERESAPSPAPSSPPGSESFTASPIAPTKADGQPVPASSTTPARTYLVAAAIAFVVILGVFAIWMSMRPVHTTQLELDFTTITATAPPGDNTPIHRIIRITGSPLRVRIRSDAPWIKALPAESKTPLTLNIDLDPTLLRSGEHSGTIRVDAGDTLRVIPVSLTVPALPEKPSAMEVKNPPLPLPAGEFSAVPSTLSFDYQLSAALPEPRSVSVSSSGAAVPFTAGVVEGGAWLFVNPSAGTTPRELAMSVRPGGLTAGEYDATVSIRPQRGDGASQSVRVHLRVLPAPRTVAAAPTVPSAPVATPPVSTSPVQTPPVQPPVAADVTPSISKAPVEPLRYGGAPRGTIVWTGVLAPGARLEFSADSASTGSMRGHLPGVDVDLDVSPADSLRVETRPSAANRYSRMVLVNSTSAQVSSIEIRWKTK